MTDSESWQETYLVALRLLAGRDYSKAALARKLQGRGFSQKQIECSVDRLCAEQFLDDRKYAERFIASALEYGRYTGFRLRQELSRRGVPADLIQALMSGRQEQSEDLEMARELLSRRFSGFDPARADDRERRRIAAFLQRRGFEADTIRKVLGRRPCVDY